MKIKRKKNKIAPLLRVMEIMFYNRIIFLILCVICNIRMLLFSLQDLDRSCRYMKLLNSYISTLHSH